MRPTGGTRFSPISLVGDSQCKCSHQESLASGFSKGALLATRHAPGRGKILKQGAMLPRPHGDASLSMRWTIRPILCPWMSRGYRGGVGLKGAGHLWSRSVPEGTFRVYTRDEVFDGGGLLPQRDGSGARKSIPCVHTLWGFRQMGLSRYRGCQKVRPVCTRGTRFSTEGGLLPQRDGSGAGKSIPRVHAGWTLWQKGDAPHGTPPSSLA